MAAALRRITQSAVLDPISQLADLATGNPEVRAAALGTLTELDARLRSGLPAEGREGRDHFRPALHDISRVLSHGP
jgi:hypothetical protein